jgi:phage shock protein C
MPVNDRLYRSRDDRVLGGVCAGLGERLDIDPTIVRVLWVVGTFFTGFVFGILLYIILLIVVPEAPEGWGPGRRAYPPYPPDPPYPPNPDPTGPPQPDAIPGWTPPEATAGAGAGATDQSTGWTPPEPTPGWTPPPPDAWAAGDAAYASRRAERRARRERNGRTFGLFFGALLIVAGVWVLLREYVPDIDLTGFWPVVIIILGLILLARAFMAPRGGANGGGTD